jgi:hypothetical protein
VELLMEKNGLPTEKNGLPRRPVMPQLGLVAEREASHGSLPAAADAAFRFHPHVWVAPAAALQAEKDAGA